MNILFLLSQEILGKLELFIYHKNSMIQLVRKVQFHEKDCSVISMRGNALELFRISYSLEVNYSTASAYLLLRLRLRKNKNPFQHDSLDAFPLFPFNIRAHWTLKCIQDSWVEIKEVTSVDLCRRVEPFSIRLLLYQISNFPMLWTISWLRCHGILSIRVYNVSGNSKILTLFYNIGFVFIRWELILSTYVSQLNFITVYLQPRNNNVKIEIGFQEILLNSKIFP